jgi:hypothetical protein
MAYCLSQRVTHCMAPRGRFLQANPIHKVAGLYTDNLHLYV